MYKDIFKSPQDVKDLKIALDFYKRITSSFANGKVIIDGLGFDTEIAEIGVNGEDLIIEVRKK